MSNTTSPWGQAAAPSTPAAAMAAATTEPDLTPSRPVYDGKLGELYAIYLRHLVLMLVTLGWSRFWGRTRIRRYLWNHFAILGDRFEYRGRGIELMVGFVLALLMLAGWGGLMYLVWIYVFHERPFASFGLFDIFSLSVALIGFPLAYVGHYAGLRYRLSRTRWRGIRCGMAGSAWRYGASATFLTFANAMTFQLLTPVVSVNLARPRIANARFGTLAASSSPAAPATSTAAMSATTSSTSSPGWWRLGIAFAAIGGAVGGLGITSRGRDPEAVHAAQPAHHPAGRGAGDRPLRRLQPADPAAALLVAGLSVPLPRRAQPRRQRAVRHGDLDAPDVGLPGAELPDRRADPGARLAVGHASHAAADRAPSCGSTARPTARRSASRPISGRATARACSTCST